MVYTHENRFFVNNAKNIIDAAGIQTQLKNEYAAGGAGDLAPLDSWLELWVVHDADVDQALVLIEAAFTANTRDQWVCEYCGETNDPAFEVCWSCQSVCPDG